MIQRIQSVFLALAAICSFGLFGTDTAETPAPVPGSEVFADAHMTVFDSPLLIGGAAGAGLLALIAIFLFRNRRLQNILCNVAVFLIAGYVTYGILLWYNDTAAAQAEIEWGIVLPALTFLFVLLASRYIKKDEKLVRSADRLR